MAQVHAHPVFIMIFDFEAWRHVFPKIGIGRYKSHLVSFLSLKLDYLGAELGQIIACRGAKDHVADFQDPYAR